MLGLRDALRKHLAAREYTFPEIELGGAFPAPEHLALCPFDRVPPAMFWHLVVLYELVYEELLARAPGTRALSECTLIDCLAQPATRASVRDNPLFELLLEALPARKTDARVTQ
jgi:hypothetical protein